MGRTGLLLCSIIALVAFCAKQEQEAPPPELVAPWYASFEDAQLRAQETGDLVLLSFEAHWCPWSRLLSESLYVHRAVVESLKSFMCASVNVDIDSLLCEEFGVMVYPTIVVTDAYGGEVGRIVGYCEPSEFLERLSLIRRRENTLAQMFKTEEQSRDDPAFLISFGRLLRDTGIYDAALIRYERAAEIDGDNRLGARAEAHYAMAECYMLAGQYKEAGRRFRLFAESYPNNERSELATVLAGLCYERIGYDEASAEIFEDYLEVFREGAFTPFIRMKLGDSVVRENS